MKISNLLFNDDCKILIYGEESIDNNIETISSESDFVGNSWAFLALNGRNTRDFNGILAHISSAKKNGAYVFIIEELYKENILKHTNIFKNCFVITIKNINKNLNILFEKCYYDVFRQLVIIGVTGTKGKTTICHMIACVLEHANKKTGIIGTLGAKYGFDSEYIPTKNTTPDMFTIGRHLNEMVKNKCEYAVMEVSSQSFLDNRLNAINFDYGIFSNITKDHIGPLEHKNFKEYLNCKSKLFRQCKYGIINIDDINSKYIIDNAKCIIKCVSLNEEKYNKDGFNKNVIAARYNENSIAVFGDIDYTFKFNGYGKFMAYNALEAVVTLHFLGIPNEKIYKYLPLCNVKGRLEEVKTNLPFKIIIDYAHNEDSMTNILEETKKICKGRIIAVFGCGGNRPKIRRMNMGRVASEKADYTIITEDNSRFECVSDIINDIISGVNKDSLVEIIIDRRKAIYKALSIARKDDIVLLLGKGHETYLDKLGKKINFDERIVISDYISKNKEMEKK